MRKNSGQSNVLPPLFNIIITEYYDDSISTSARRRRMRLDRDKGIYFLPRVRQIFQND